MRGERQDPWTCWTDLSCSLRENRPLRGKSGGGFESEADELMKADQVCPGPRKEKQGDNSRTRKPTETEQEREHL